MQNNQIQVNKHKRRAQRESTNHKPKLQTSSTRVNTYFFLLVAEDLCFPAALEPATAFLAFVLGSGAGELGTATNKFDLDANVRACFKFAGGSRDS
jgi:hypothetical protein